jgi:hypothetical protein
MPLIKPHNITDLEYIRTDTHVGDCDFIEHWNWQGRSHSINDHPSVITHYSHMTVTQWHRSGIPHRDEHCGPAYQTCTKMIYYNAGFIHRRNGPIIQNDPDRHYWYWHGEMASDLDHWYEMSQVSPELFVLLKLQYG